MMFNATFSYIVTVSFIGGGTRSTTENHRSAASQLPLKIKIVLGENLTWQDQTE